MKIEKSCGAVLFTNTAHGRNYVLVKTLAGEQCGFPKGHVEAGETEEQTALREIFEETCINAEIVAGFRDKLEYEMPNGDTKQVIYFIAEYKNQTPARRLSEPLEVLSLPFCGALEALSFDNLKQLMRKADSWLKNRAD